MTCDHVWTIKFRDVNYGEPFEVRPIEMSLKMSRHEYDFCRAKFSWEVGEEMKPHTRYEDGALYGITPVDVCYNGTAIQRLMFRPDWADYSSENTHLQFHDLHKALSNGTIDEQRQTVQLEDIYQTVVEAASNRLIDTINFTVPDEQVRSLYGEITTAGRAGAHRRQQIEQDNTKKAVKSDYAVDFENISPENALRRLNKKFRLKTWVNREGELVVGLPEANSIRHIAASDDERVWRYKDPNISHGREPIKRAIVEGAWVDEPGLGGIDDGIDEVASWFNGDDQGGADVKAMGIAERTDIDYGTEFAVKSSNAKRDALPEIAILALKERMKQQNAGTVEIDPELSGTEVSNVLDLDPGDFLHLVPEDDYFDNPTASSGKVGDKPEDMDEVCGGFVNNEAYLVSEVEHSVTDTGEWQVFADVGMYPDVPIDGSMSYFEPDDNSWVDDNEISDDGSLSGGWLGFESI
jgi:hypothetical protein